MMQYTIKNKQVNHCMIQERYEPLINILKNSASLERDYGTGTMKKASVMSIVKNQNITFFCLIETLMIYSCV